jgi:hypothetical protein
MSRFREPGRVNINTIHDPAIWRAVTRLSSNFANVDETRIWQDFLTSRDGQASQTVDSQTTNPFRSAYHGISLSLLRPEDSATQKLIRSEGLLTGAATGNQDRLINPYFEFDGLQRLYNLFSTQSNVYAIWITVGKFETDENGQYLPNDANPRELGADTGNIRRHRGFYIIDRSIPVAYEPGKRHNIDNCVLLRRFIE